MAKWTWRGPDDDDATEAVGRVEVDDAVAGRERAQQLAVGRAS
jgi:hypothetical protein